MSEPTQHERVAQLITERDALKERLESAEAARIAARMDYTNVAVELERVKAKDVEALTQALKTDIARDRDACRQALQLLLDAVERGFHLTSKHPLVARAAQLLNIRDTPTSQSGGTPDGSLPQG